MDGWLRSRLIIASQSLSHVLWLPLIIATTIKFQVTCFECSLGYVQFSNTKKRSQSTADWTPYKLRFSFMTSMPALSSSSSSSGFGGL
jgi:hypothetical protein